MLVFKTWYFGDKIYENVGSIKANQKKQTKIKENILIVKNKNSFDRSWQYCVLLKRIISLL